VLEETGLSVTGWEGPLWHVEAEAPDMGWTLRVEVHRATGFEGVIAVEDPDGIVVDVAWLDLDGCTDCLATSWLPAREPMLAWLGEKWLEPRTYRYRLEGADRADANVIRLD
jgi:hypothetical protein